MKNYRLKIQYDGTRYRGWQRLAGREDTIQGKIENVLSRLLDAPVQLDGAGRTDAGVHARCQVANAHLACRWEPDELKQKLNEYLPEDIRILEVSLAGERFHSRLHALAKAYEYHLLKEGCYDVFTRRYCWQMTQPLDLERMREAAGYLTGEHDFRGFCTKASKKKSTVRRLDKVEIRETEDSIFLRFEGNGFLYNMVRIMTGTLVEVGTGKREPETIRDILQQKERSLAGEKAPAQGLTLLTVRYD